MAEQEIDKTKVGNYELTGVIASGSSCQIWEATDGTQSWAVKVLLPEKLSEAEERNSLKHEGQILQKLTHPVFVAYRDMRISRKEAFLVMEYFRGPNLKSMIKTNRVSIHVHFERLLEQLCLGLSYMHELGLVHRDIKPENILFAKSGELKLIDFSLTTKFKTGLAAALSGKQKTIQGTRTYIAPETIMKKAPTPQTDMYSLGITLYEALTGRTPFAGASPNDLLLKHLMDVPLPPSSHEPNVSVELDNFVLKLLAKKPKNRFADMNEAYSELRSMKLFKEEPGNLDDRKREVAKQVENASYEEVLDSRKDAERTAAGIVLPKREKKAPPKLLPKTQKTTTAQQMPSQQPMPQQAPQQMPYGYQMPPPGYPQQPMAEHGQQMMPGMYPYPMPPQGYPQQWPGPQQPPMPGQPMPQQGQGGPVPVPPQNPQGSPAAPQPTVASQPQPAKPLTSPPNQPEAKQQMQASIIPGRSVTLGSHPSQRGNEDDDLPQMDELPEVI